MFWVVFFGFRVWIGFLLECKKPIKVLKRFKTISKFLKRRKNGMVLPFCAVKYSF